MITLFDRFILRFLNRQTALIFTLLIALVITGAFFSRRALGWGISPRARATNDDIPRRLLKPSGRAVKAAMKPLTNVPAGNAYVDPAGGCGGNLPCFTTIQAAIDAATAGDTISVGAGSYNEDVNVNKAGLSLLGVGSGTVTVSGPASGAAGFRSMTSTIGPARFPAPLGAPGVGFGKKVHSVEGPTPPSPKDSSRKRGG